jgi:hypothetical protein
MTSTSNYVGGDVSAPAKYELRINGTVTETSSNVVDLYWKARWAVCGKPEARAEVEAVSGFYVNAFFSDDTLLEWERAAV